MKLQPLKILALLLGLSITYGYANIYDEAKLQLDRQNYKQALKSLDKIKTKDADWYKIRGAIFHQMFVVDSSAIYLKEAYDLGKLEDYFLVILSEDLLWMNDYNTSKQVLDLVENKNTVPYLMVLATLQEKAEELKSSLYTYDQILSYEPDNFNAQLKKAKVLGWMKEFQLATKAYTNLLKNSKANSKIKEKALLGRAEVLAWSKNLKDANVDINKLLSKNPKNTEALLLKASWYEWAGEYKKAKLVYEEVLNIDPENYLALLKIEKLLWVN